MVIVCQGYIIEVRQYRVKVFTTFVYVYHASHAPRHVTTHLSTNGIIPGLLKFQTCLKDVWKVEILSDDCTTQKRKEVLASGWIGFNENILKWDFF